MTRTYLETALCPEGAFAAIEMHDVLKGNETAALKSLAAAGSAASEVQDNIRAMIMDAPAWLPFAAEPYQISAELADFVLVPQIIMPSDLPNRNGVGFPFRELTRFNTDAGTLSYRTWKGKPTHVEHQNQILDAAKGVVFDASIRRITRASGDVWKVMCLCGFDRKKDPYLANQILTGERPSASMGAYVRDYACTICGTLHSKGGCEHVKHGKPEYKIFAGRLAYLEAVDPMGFEISSVQTPAFVSATNPHKFMLGEK